MRQNKEIPQPMYEINRSASASAPWKVRKTQQKTYDIITGATHCWIQNILVPPGKTVIMTWVMSPQDSHVQLALQQPCNPGPASSVRSELGSHTIYEAARRQLLQSTFHYGYSVLTETVFDTKIEKLVRWVLSHWVILSASSLDAVAFRSTPLLSHPPKPALWSRWAQWNNTLSACLGRSDLTANPEKTAKHSKVSMINFTLQEIQSLENEFSWHCNLYRDPSDYHWYLSTNNG